MHGEDGGRRERGLIKRVEGERGREREREIRREREGNGKKERASGGERGKRQRGSDRGRGMKNRGTGVRDTKKKIAHHLSSIHTDTDIQKW